MENLLTKYLAKQFEEVAPKDFYRLIFPAGELEKKGEYITGKYTGIIVAVTSERKPNGKRLIKRYTLTDELDAIDTAVNSSDFCLCSPVSYIGKQRTAEHARMLYAIAIDVDRIRMEPNPAADGCPCGLADLLHQIKAMQYKFIPRPTFIVSSGNGLHLYYVFEKPVPLYPEIAREMQVLKHELTIKCWDSFVCDINSVKDIQQEGIYQGFRMPGTVTKDGARAKAFSTGGKVSLDYLNSFVCSTDRATKAATKAKKKLTIAEAAKKYPEWYQRRIVEKQPRGVWCVNRNLYEWWKRQITSGAEVGHRYYCLMMLAVYAKKCSYFDPKHNPNPVTREELEKDCFDLLPVLDARTTKEDNHFLAADVLDALEAFDERWTSYPRSAIEYKSGISIPEKKRNGRKVSTHLKIARNTLAILNEENGAALQGRKSRREDVERWQSLHPNGTIKECIAETGISKSTVYRHWKKADGGGKE